MTAPPTKAPTDIVHDAERLAEVRSTGLLDTPVEAGFDRLTRLAAKLTGAPATFISLVDETHDFYKSCYGFPEPLASSRQLTGTTFCHYALASEEPLVIDNAPEDPVYSQVPTVKSLGVQAYLGIPLVVGGHAIGSFCAIDFKPHAWTPLDIEVMQELAASTLREIELRRALRTLGDERRLLDVLLHEIPVAVLYAEAPSGKITLMNRRAEEILPGFAALRDDEHREKVLGTSADGTPLALAEWPTHRAILGESVASAEVQVEMPDGRRTWVRVAAAPVRDGEERIIGGVAVFDSIDADRAMRIENARLYEEAQQANRAKDEFFAAVTHELRSPMTSIIGWTRLLKMQLQESPDAIEAIESITSSALLQAQLVDDLLDVSRIATGKLTLKRERLRLNESVQEAVKSALPLAESKGVTLRTALGEDGILEADKGRIQQIINNLLSNATKFTPRGGLIEISANAAADHASITVRDTGRGIDPSLLPHIFERFRQAKTAEMGGLGLGLTIVKHLVDMHGGDITAESEGEGKGAAFCVRLPLQQAS